MRPVNNAGGEGKPGPVTEQSVESHAATFDTNVLGTLPGTKHELRLMQPQGSGSNLSAKGRRVFWRASKRGRHGNQSRSACSTVSPETPTEKPA
jgi:NAD(P)-dependent dehydrogenase (short-subunit alcohol dehydrogenase family)